jgi:hypothetical protein
MASNRALALLFLAALACTASAQSGDNDAAPAPASVGADVPLTYFGPPPSSVVKELVGPLQLLTAGKVDADKGTVRLPLYTGHYADGSMHFYVLTDVSDKSVSELLGINYSPKINFLTTGLDDTPYLNGTNSLLMGRRGKVDFSPVRSIVAGDEPSPFPPKSVVPGSVGDGNYSPYIRVANIGYSVWNAPIVAGGITPGELNKWCDGIPDNELADAQKYVHDKVVQICPRNQTVTFSLTQGFSFSKPVLYLSLDASAEVPAAFEAVNLAPRLSKIDVGGDDSAFSAVERLFGVINGYSNSDLPAEGRPDGLNDHPTRQGFFSALRDKRSPLNVFGGIPTVATDYSPVWDLNLGVWTDFAVKNNLRVRWLEEFQILGFAERGIITAPDGSKFGSSGLLINCPIVSRLL